MMKEYIKKGFGLGVGYALSNIVIGTITKIISKEPTSWDYVQYLKKNNLQYYEEIKNHLKNNGKS